MAVAATPKRGEVWTVNFDPTIGAEIGKGARNINFGKTFAEWSRTAFPGRRVVTTSHDGLGRPSYEASSPFG